MTSGSSGGRRQLPEGDAARLLADVTFPAMQAGDSPAFKVTAYAAEGKDLFAERSTNYT
jgi:hypothetical protein